MREWITPRLNMQHVEVTEATDDGSSSTNVDAQIIAPTADLTTPTDVKAQHAPATMSGIHPSPFQIRLNHFLLAIEEQNERYTTQKAVEESQARKDAGRQRLIEMAADLHADGKPRKRGFRLWLARLFGLVP
jgi:transitional endoplasmic reticulum ATPase